jgi:signal peptidase I
MNKKFRKLLIEARSWGTIIIIALLLKVTIIEAYIVPTGSMEETIMTGDFLIGNRFVYGMRTPDWIGIPYTDIGFKVPYIRFPKFKEPHQGDVIIFKYPRDVFHKYVKRCIAEPGDSLKIVARKVYVNNVEFELSPNGKFMGSMLPVDFVQQDMFHPDQGNKDFFKAIRLPQKGDTVLINKETDWRFYLPIVLLDGHEATLESEQVKYQFSMSDPNDLFRRKEDLKVFDDYFPNGKFITPWSQSIKDSDFQFLKIDGIPITELDQYVIEQGYYWAMGDNRDDSLDSRYWGFIPEDYILGEALIVYFSLDLNTWIPRFDRIFTVIR